LGRQYDIDKEGKGATFLEASFETRQWAFPGSRCCDVILGNGNTLRFDVDAGEPINGWLKIPLDKKLVEALVSKASFGLALVDGSTGIDRNCFISSREGKHPPYLEITTIEDDANTQKPPINIVLISAPNDANNISGAIKISLSVPENAFSYNILINGNVVPRWQIPFAQKEGVTQSFIIEDLEPNSEIIFEIAAVSASGNISRYVQVKGKSSVSITVPKLPLGEKKMITEQPAKNLKSLLVWAFPEGCKLDPLSGKINLEKGMENAKINNSLWDAKSSTIHLSAARGEIVGFQVALEASLGSIDNLKLSFSGLKEIKTQLWRTWFVKIKETWQAEYAIPMKIEDKISIPALDNEIGGQKAAVVAIDLIIPPSIANGQHLGILSIASPEGVLSINIIIDIYKAVIPDEINFNPELNDYGGPAEVGSSAFFDYYRLAHYNRCTINCVPYSQGGRIDKLRVPVIGINGNVIDWEQFDKNIGPLLDGSAFAENPRKNMPVPTFYLPHFENWPMLIKNHYKPGDKAVLSGKDWKGLHDIWAKPIENSFSLEYQKGFTQNVFDFVNHFEAKGWTKTSFEFYMNNKPKSNEMASTAWTLDEPNEFLDWNALNFFSLLFHNGTKNAKKTRFLMRGDISRPEWQGSSSDGKMEIMYANNSQLNMPRLMREHKRRMPTIIYCYGSCNDQNRSNHETFAWCLKAFVHECDGVLPWKTLADDSAFIEGDSKGENALIVDGRKRFGVSAIASFRVHSLRSSAQLIELLRLLIEKKGWGRAHAEALVSQLIPLESKFVQLFSEDAAAVTFENLNGDKLVLLKEGLLRLLD
jgi:hypothetical protein